MSEPATRRRRRPRPSTSPPVDRPALRQALARRVRTRAGRWSWPRSASACWPALLIPYRDLGLAFFLVLLAAGGTVWWAAKHRTRPVHGHLPGAGGPVHAAGRAAGRRVDRRPVPAGRHGQPGRRRDPRTPPGRSSWWPGSRGRCPRCADSPGSPGACAACSASRPRSSRAADGAVVVRVRCSCSASCSRPPTRVVAEWLDGRRARPHDRPRSCSAAFTGVFVGGATLAAAYLALNPPDVSAVPGGPATAAAHRYEWLVPVLLVDAVFSRLPGRPGDGRLRRARLPRVGRTGLTSGDYVHQGFGQLTVATALTLLVVWAAAREEGTPRDVVRPDVAARCPRPAVRAHPRRGRIGALPDARLPGGLRLHPVAPAGRRLQGLARSAGPRRDGGGRCRTAGLVAATGRGR